MPGAEKKAGAGGWLRALADRIRKKLHPEIPPDLLERLIALGEYPDGYVGRPRSINELRSLVEHREQERALALKWAPKLRAFAAEFRRSNPCPAEDSLSEIERAKLDILDPKIRGAELLSRRRELVVICALPLFAIPRCQQIWPGECDRCVFLTPEETAQWQGLYSHPRDLFWWFAYYWWNVLDPPPENVRWCIENELTAPDWLGGHVPITVPDGAEPWLVDWGRSCGLLAGAGQSEIWAWNGREAKFVSAYGSWIS